MANAAVEQAEEKQTHTQPAEKKKLVFGLDIGTRSIVGTVGYKEEDSFIVVSERVKEHESRAMLDGQIHDIRKVGETILDVKRMLEEDIGEPLKGVCIAAAGRVLRTVNTHVELHFESERQVVEEDLFELVSLGIEQAYADFLKDNDTEVQFYCVGYSIVRHFLNGYQMTNLEEHKAKSIGMDLIATFLPEDVVDGLYKAVEIADLEVVNMTLEPIAAIQVAIPEKFRMLNIALVDVGAGTSDISVTEGGSVTAYGMIPIAGDALTEAVAQYCLVEFSEAEKIKRAADGREVIEFEDIMGLSQTISTQKVLEVTAPVIDKMTGEVAEKIKELNGGKPVSAVFVVGGGGKLSTYTDALADKLGIAHERVAVRGEEVMQRIVFRDESVKKDSLLVTPIGICLSYYEQSNNFIFVTFNGKRHKLYDNSRLAVVDVAMQVKYPNEKLFPRRGKELNYRVNGVQRFMRGELGEAAVITVNGAEADMYTPVHGNDVIVVEESTAGAPAALEIGKLPECGENISVLVNDQRVVLPKFASVNGELQSEYYDIQDGDDILFLPYYTVRQITEFMDVILEKNTNIYVNNKRADMDTKVYDNFALIWSLEELQISDVEADKKKEEERLQALQQGDFSRYLPSDDDADEEELEEQEPAPEQAQTAGTDAVNAHAQQPQQTETAAQTPTQENVSAAQTPTQENVSAAQAPVQENVSAAQGQAQPIQPQPIQSQPPVQSAPEQAQPAGADAANANAQQPPQAETAAQADGAQDMTQVQEAVTKTLFTNPELSDPVEGMTIIVNGQAVTLKGKESYIFVDVFDAIDFDLSTPQGSGIVTDINGRPAQYMEALHPMDKLDIYWKE